MARIFKGSRYQLQLLVSQTNSEIENVKIEFFTTDVNQYVAVTEDITIKGNIASVIVGSTLFDSLEDGVLNYIISGTIDGTAFMAERQSNYYLKSDSQSNTGASKVIIPISVEFTDHTGNSEMLIKAQDYEADGFSEVQVNANNYGMEKFAAGYSDGYQQGRIEGSGAKLGHLNAEFEDMSGNGEAWWYAYERDLDGFNYVSINASAYGNMKYQQGYNDAGNKGGFDVDSIGDGTFENPYNVSQAREFAGSLEDGATSDICYVKGIVARIENYDGDTITYDINSSDRQSIRVRNGKNFGGEPFYSQDDLKINYMVIVRCLLGKLEVEGQGWYDVCVAPGSTLESIDKSKTEGIFYQDRWITPNGDDIIDDDFLIVTPTEGYQGMARVVVSRSEASAPMWMYGLCESVWAHALTNGEVLIAYMDSWLTEGNGSLSGFFDEYYDYNGDRFYYISDITYTNFIYRFDGGNGESPLEDMSNMYNGDGTIPIVYWEGFNCEHVQTIGGAFNGWTELRGLGRLEQLGKSFRREQTLDLSMTKINSNPNIKVLIKSLYDFSFGRNEYGVSTSYIKGLSNYREEIERKGWQCID